jgi:hypothetical protein
MKERKLSSYINWQRALQQKGVKQTNAKQGLVAQKIVFTKSKLGHEACTITGLPFT